jgi:XRE family transcriptional regulator, aerobic/anaerobic benzoate catabolism transcriptional regulator
LRSAAKSANIMHMQNVSTLSEMRRGSAPAAEAYLKAVGQRVRQERQRLTMSRRALAETSGVSERYLAELERGAGNASLLVLRRVAQALSLRIEDLASEPNYAETNLAAE